MARAVNNLAQRVAIYRHVTLVLKLTGGNVSEAAKQLEIPRRTLQRMRNRYRKSRGPARRRKG